MKNSSGNIILSLLIVFLFVDPANAQQTLAEQLGYAADAKLLIVHADDI